jgi:D-alanyl-D-alanine carboxypeptidase/D-alanyl-D-alanine-endopeptidase (penicillin-binding protein 4)
MRRLIGRSVIAVVVTSALSASTATGIEARAPARPAWKVEIDELVEGLQVGVSVREAGQFLYRHADKVRRTPASNQKLLLAMALLDRLGPGLRIPILARANIVEPGGVIPGNLWIIGRGDPHVGPNDLADLAQDIADAGITRVRGSVKGATTYFARDWWARGWKPYFPDEYIPLPSALTYLGNVDGGRHIRDPERRAARELTAQLRAVGISVGGPPAAGEPPPGLQHIAAVRSPTLIVLLQNMLNHSINFSAEVLGKRLGVDRYGVPGTIAKGARAVAGWVAGMGVQAIAYDGSGLSYANSVSPAGIARLLGEVEELPWGDDLMGALPGPGQGTLTSRLAGVPVRAKTGTLTERSALSGWVYLQETATWAEFSIISKGLPVSRAKGLEDRIVRILWRDARVPAA